MPGRSKRKTNTYHRSVKTNVCLHYLAGRCNFGNACRFAHGAAATEAQSVAKGVTKGKKKTRAKTRAKTTTPKAQQQRRPRRSRHFKTYIASQQASQRTLATSKTSTPCATPSTTSKLSVLSILNDHNLLEILQHLNIQELGLTVATCCKALHRFQSNPQPYFGHVLWQKLYHSLFKQPSVQWSLVLKSFAPQPATVRQHFTAVDWKYKVHQRTVREHRWLKKACYDHQVHAAGRQTLQVGPTQEFQSIQEALNVASGYDTIVVHPGNYSDQTIRIEKSVEIIGAAASQVSPASLASPPHCNTSSAALTAPFGSPVSVANVPVDEVNPMATIARQAAERTFLATLGKVFIAAHAKVRFSRVRFGGDDSVVSFNGQDDTRRNGSKSFCNFDECSFTSTLFVLDNTLPSLEVVLDRCIVVGCDSVLMGHGGGAATVRPFGLDLPRLDDDVDAHDVPHGFASLNECCGLP
jgi:hypothetical protein